MNQGQCSLLSLHEIHDNRTNYYLSHLTDAIIQKFSKINLKAQTSKIDKSI